MLTVPVNQAKDKFSSLLQAVESGEDVVITRHGKQVARLVRATEVSSDPVTVNQDVQNAIKRLKALHARVKPAIPGKTDWKTLRDMGRKY